MTHSHVWHDSFVTHHLHLLCCAVDTFVTQSQIWYESFTCVTWRFRDTPPPPSVLRCWHIHNVVTSVTFLYICIYLVWHFYLYVYTYIYVYKCDISIYMYIPIHNEVTSVTFLIYICDMTHLWHTTSIFGAALSTRKLKFWKDWFTPRQSKIHRIKYLTQIMKFCTWLHSQDCNTHTATHVQHIATCYITYDWNPWIVHVTDSYVWKNSFICVTWPIRDWLAQICEYIYIIIYIWIHVHVNIYICIHLYICI